MAQVRSDFERPLRIFTDPQRSRATQAVFGVVRGDDTPREVTRCSLGDLGLPDSLAGVRRLEDEQLTVPKRVIDDLQRAVTEVGASPSPPENALWLEFPSPRGFLYIAPWERLLASVDRTMFRLPYHLVRPQAPGPRLDVAICVSTPEAKTGFSVFEVLEPLVRQYLSHTRDQVAVHIFTDEQWFYGLDHDLSFHGTEGEVVVHDPKLRRSTNPPPTWRERSANRLRCPTPGSSGCATPSPAAHSTSSTSSLTATSRGIEVRSHSPHHRRTTRTGPGRDSWVIRSKYVLGANGRLGFAG